MSEVVHFIGNLRKIVPEEDETFNVLYKRLICSIDGSLSKYNSINVGIIDYIRDYLEEYYIFIGNDIYEILEKKSISSDGDIFRAVENKNGTIDFEVRYYNGGCGFQEAVDDAFKKIELL